MKHININFYKGFLSNKSFNAWTRYQLDEDYKNFKLDVIFNEHCFFYTEKEIISILVHELEHCAFYQMHANKLVTDEEVIMLNELIDDGYPTLHYEIDD